MGTAFSNQVSPLRERASPKGTSADSPGLTKYATRLR